MPHILEGGKILDLGCGSGRDSLHFMKLGYVVVVIDGSLAMCLEAERVMGQAVQCVDIMERLLPDGILYGSWKYGEEKRVEEGRYFQDFMEDGLRAIFGELDGCLVQKYWISEDVGADKSSVKWSNIIIRKNNNRRTQ